MNYKENDKGVLIMKVGDKVYLLPSGNATRHIKDSLVNHIIETEIVSIGRKYVTVSFWNGMKFKLDETCRGGYAEKTEYSCDYYMYESKQEILDMLETNELNSKIKSYFSIDTRKKLSLEQLRKIIEIIES